MPLTESLLTGLFKLSPQLFGQVWKRIPANKPIAKAIVQTCDHYGSRFPGLQMALIQWTVSHHFQGHEEHISKGGIGQDIDEIHIAAFVEVTGIRLGIPDPASVRAMLTHFYQSLLSEMVGGGPQALIARKIDQLQSSQTLISSRETIESHSIKVILPSDSRAVNRCISRPSL